MTGTVDSIADTIVARATPPGEGGIAVVRLSGPKARAIACVVAPRSSPVRSHQMVRAAVRGAQDELIDDALVVEMHAPRSYTGEDVVELHLHGSRVVVAAVIEACLRVGARLARPGEYTLRAFLHGRIDLAQAEAVGDLIASTNDRQRVIAAGHLEGTLSKAVGDLLETLEGVLADCRAALDFPEYNTGTGFGEGHLRTLEDIRCNIQELIDNARLRARTGLQVVLCGAPNAGKSTLINAWAGGERVLVDVEPGTTRDPIEVEMTGFSNSVRWSVCDTAGVRDNATGVEARGIEMSRDRIRNADVALWLVASDSPTWPTPDLNVMGVEIVLSKIDLVDESIQVGLEQEAVRRGLRSVGSVSAKTGVGVDELRQRLVERVDAPVREDVAVVVRQRHLEALKRASAALARVRNAFDEGLTLDVMTLEVEQATYTLGEILGRNVDTEVLDKIFSQFCIGK